MNSRITIEPEVHSGKPCIAGTRITVQNVLELVREGITFESITRDYYPSLSLEDIQACIQHAMDTVALEEINLATPKA